MPAARHEQLLRSLYGAFNARDVESCLAAMTADVDWANGWEGGRVVGRDAVRDYWERQWAAIDSTAEPTAVTERLMARSRSPSTSWLATTTGRWSTTGTVGTSTTSAATSYSA